MTLWFILVISILMCLGILVPIVHLIKIEVDRRKRAKITRESKKRKFLR